jgi:hypothetical protein
MSTLFFTYVAAVPQPPLMGQCTGCKHLGPISQLCDCKPDEFAMYQESDLNLIHLDEMEPLDDNDPVETEDDETVDTALAVTTTFGPYTRMVPCIHTSLLNAYPSDYAIVFDKMLIDIIENRWKRFNMKAFLKHVANYLLGHFGDCTMVLLLIAEFMQDYAFNLVNLGIETVAMLLSDIFHVNDRLRSEKFKVFDNHSLDAIVHLAPIWIKAEYRFSLRLWLNIRILYRTKL